MPEHESKSGARQAPDPLARLGDDRAVGESAPSPLVTLHPAASPCIELQEVYVSQQGVEVLKGVTLCLPNRGISVILGPNGAGKSVLLRVLMGLIPTQGGMLKIAPDLEDHIALVFQRPILLRRSVKANLLHALSLARMPRPRRGAKAESLLRLGGLAHLADHPARSLSGGEQQRLALVRAFAMEPKILLLDEPTASLDPQSIAALEALIASAVSDGVKAVLVTHSTEQAKRLANDVIFLHDGMVQEHCPAAEFFQNPQSKAAQAYLAGELLVT